MRFLMSKCVFYRYNLFRIPCISTILNVIDIGFFNMTLYVFYYMYLFFFIHKGYIFFDTFYVIERFDPCATLAEQLAGVVKSQMGSRLLSDITILYVPTYKHYINTDRTGIYI